MTVIDIVLSTTFTTSFVVTIHWNNTTIKTTSVCDGDARSVGGGRGCLAGDTDGLAGWPVTVGVVSQPGADAERYRCACLHCTQGLAGRGDGYQCSLDWGRYIHDAWIFTNTFLLQTCVRQIEQKYYWLKQRIEFFQERVTVRYDTLYLRALESWRTCKPV